MTRCWSKSSPIFPKVAQEVANVVLHKSKVFQNIPKICQSFGPLLLEILLPITFENRPIWPHCYSPTWALLNDKSGYESAGRAVTSETRNPQLESSHWQFLLTISCIKELWWKDETKEKEAVVFPLKTDNSLGASQNSAHPYVPAILQVWVRITSTKFMLFQLI